MEKWRLEHPHDTPPYRFTPSPTFSHSSRAGSRFEKESNTSVQRVTITLDDELMRALDRYIETGGHRTAQSLSGKIMQDCIIFVA